MSNTADMVTRAIVAASSAMNVDPIIVASRGFDNRMSKTFPVSRARAYAAIAIKKLLPDFGPTAIGRMVGSSTPEAYLSTLERRLHLGECSSWYDPVIQSRVLQAAGGES